MATDYDTKTAERLARIEASQEFTAKNIADLSSAIKKMLEDHDKRIREIEDQKASKNETDGLDDRIRVVEARIWYASGAVGSLSLFAQPLLKKLGLM